MNIDNVNTNLISFDKVFKTKKYTLLTYDHKPLKIIITNVDFISSFYNEKKNIFVFKFNISDKYVDFFNKLSQIAKNLVKLNKNMLYDNSISDTEIDNLYFSNLDDNLINVQSNSLEIFKNIKSLNGNSIKITVHISGLWFYQKFYGLCFEIDDIANM